MRYDFPIIQHIDHVLPHIDEDCFKVIEKDCGHTYINYVKMGPDTFPPFLPETPQTLEHNHDHYENERDAHNHRAAIRRECRGLAFLTRTGQLVSRPFHKFFNVGEREDMDIGVLPWDEPHWVQDKVDGSMVRPIWTSAGIRWGTKMGVTDTALIAEDWLIDNPQYEALAKYAIEHGRTPIFEFTSPKTRVVVDYGRPTMTLLAIRDNDKGTYASPDAVAHEARRYNLPSVRMYDPVEGDPTTYIKAVRDSDDLDEGVVVWWPGGGAAKCKTDTYSILHKVKESARTERTLVTAILEGTVDDLLPMLPLDERSQIMAYVTRFWRCCSALEDDIAELYRMARDAYETKKDFAIGTAGAKALTRLESSTVFALWDGKRKDAQEAAMEIVRQGLISETKWAAMKENIAMATSFNDFATGWKGKDDDFE